MMMLFTFDCIRYAILENLSKMDGKIDDQFELDEVYFSRKCKENRGCRTKNTIIVFGFVVKAYAYNTMSYTIWFRICQMWSHVFILNVCMSVCAIMFGISSIPPLVVCVWSYLPMRYFIIHIYLFYLFMIFYYYELY